jgi:uncharacterized membrane protein
MSSSAGARAGDETTGATATPAASTSKAPASGRLDDARRVLRRLLDRYPELPPAPRGRLARIAPYLVALLALGFVVYFSVYLFALHDAYQTSAEDLGIMDQALWNTLHGAPLHQTICNNLTDTNCLGDVSRLAIHFEPLLFPIALLYVVAPSPKTLLFFQALAVAAGAFPAYWIALRRLQSPVAGIAFAIVYLLYPALDSAITSSFHAVTLSAAFIMFALYFMLTRNNVGLFAACLLAIATKEEVPLDVAMIGLSVALLQRRWRVGLSLVALAGVWVVLYLLVTHAVSPLGHSPTSQRYAYLGRGPVQAVVFALTHPLAIVRQHVLDPAGRFYLRALLSGSGYLAILSPLTLLIAAPVLALNLLSADPSMRAGIYQYNAEIVPVFVLAAIESVALLAWAVDCLAVRAGLPADSLRLPAALDSRLRATGAALARAVTRFGRTRAVEAGERAGGEQHERAPFRVPVGRVAMAGLTLLALAFSLHEQQNLGYLPIGHAFQWPQQTAHTRLVDALIKRIPATASVSAQADLVPHLSQRRHIYQYPYDAMNADYVLLDVTGFIYPYTGVSGGATLYVTGVKTLLQSGRVHVIAAQDGYLLLAHGAGPALDPADALGLPPSFYTFTEARPGTTIGHPLDARFGGALQLVGYDVTPTERPYVGASISLVTYWRVLGPVPQGATPQLALNVASGVMHINGVFPSTSWRPMGAWQPGTIMIVRQDQTVLGGNDVGTMRLGIRVLAGASGPPLSATLASPAGAGGSPPFVLPGGAGIMFGQVEVR